MGEVYIHGTQPASALTMPRGRFVRSNAIAKLQSILIKVRAQRAPTLAMLWQLQRSLCAGHECSNQDAKILETVCHRRALRHCHHADGDQSLIRIDDEILPPRS